MAAYLAESFAENKPWDKIVHELLASDGTEEQLAGALKFYLVRDVAPHQLTRDVGRLFLGVDLQCASVITTHASTNTCRPITSASTLFSSESSCTR